MNRTELLEKARKLPLLPGVYIMKNPSGRVIYVGKSKALKNRVSSYFQQTHHTAKTEKMVQAVSDFEVFFTTSEIEALILENQFIKQYLPRYNIKLKDSKSYPYIRLTAGEYPKIEVVKKRDDSSTYYGPFSSGTAAWKIADSVSKAMLLPSCKKSFPKDFNTRPCLNYHIGVCIAPCCREISHEEYMEQVSSAKRILRGDTKELLKELAQKMQEASDELMFERAARCRDCIEAIKKLDSQQKIVAKPEVNEDVFGFYTDDLGSSAAVMIVRNGCITDRESFFFPADEILDSAAVAALMQRFYQLRGFVPGTVLCGELIGHDDCRLLEEYLLQELKAKTSIIIPVKGDRKKRVDMASENAKELMLHARTTQKREQDFLISLAKLLSLEAVPLRIEAYDISNDGESHTTAGMIVLEDGKFCKKKYRSFNIGTVVTDDYGAMREALHRRFSHSEQGWELPDLILIDGGVGHVGVAKQVMEELKIELPVFGMVKDEFHKTRTLTDGQGEISIAKKQEFYVFFYKIQEEVHRFALARMNVKRVKRVKRSILEDVSGIGQAKAKALNAKFGGLRGIKQATKEELMSVKGITEANAQAILEALSPEPKDRQG